MRLAVLLLSLNCILQFIEIFTFSLLLALLIASNCSFELTICCVNLLKLFVLQKNSSVFCFFAVFVQGSLL